MLILFVLWKIVLAEVQEYACDIDISEKACIEESGFEVTRPWAHPDLFGKWTFDYEKWIDESPLKHITNVEGTERTYSLTGFGSAARFTKDSVFEVFLVPPFHISESSLTFIVFFEDLIKTTGFKGDEAFCGIINLFEHMYDHSDAQKYIRIGVDSQNRTFTLHLVKENGDQVVLSTKMKINPLIWYRVYLVVTEYVTLYVNGYVEIQFKLKYETLVRHMAIANIMNPNQQKCPVSYVIDSLELYHTPLTKFYVHAASDQFSGFASILYLGCQECTLSKAKVCQSGFHLCTTLELYAFGLNTARGMGWANITNAKFWSADTDVDQVSNQDLGTQICCRNIQYA